MKGTGTMLKGAWDTLLPTVFALSAEQYLKTMSKDSKESLLQFLCQLLSAIIVSYHAENNSHSPAQVAKGFAEMAKIEEVRCD